MSQPAVRVSKDTISASARVEAEETWCHTHTLPPTPQTSTHRPEHTKRWTFLWAFSISYLTCSASWICMPRTFGRCCCLRCWFCSRRPTCIVNHCQVHKGSVMTHRLWLVAVRCFMQPLRHVESCPFWLLFLLHIFTGCDVTTFGFGQAQSIWRKY